MKKIVGVSVVGAVLVGAVVLGKGAIAAATPEARACVRMGELCGAEEKSSARLKTCAEELDKAKSIAGQASVDRSLKCVEESKTCGAVTGGLAGGIGVGAVGELMKGFGSALSP